MSDLTCLRNYRIRFQAEQFQGYLQAEGIPAMVIADDAGGWRPELALASGGARLCVRPDDVERALAVLEELEAGADSLEE